MRRNAQGGLRRVDGGIKQSAQKLLYGCRHLERRIGIIFSPPGPWD